MASIFFGWLVDSTAQDDRFRSRACSIREYIRFAFIARVVFFFWCPSICTLDCSHRGRAYSASGVEPDSPFVPTWCRLLSLSSAFVVVCFRCRLQARVGAAGPSLLYRDICRLYSFAAHLLFFSFRHRSFTHRSRPYTPGSIKIE